MSQKLCIGIQHLDEDWAALLNQAGLWFREVDYHAHLLSEYSAIIINRTPDNEQAGLLKNYLDKGGALIEMEGHVVFNNRADIHSVSQKTLFQEKDHPAYSHIPFADVFSKVGLYKNSGLYGGFICTKKVGKGILGYMGANIASLLQDTRYARKRFYSPEHPSPDEIASKVSKKDLADLFTAFLKDIHLQRGLPFVQKWISPSLKPIFCFRIDSDFGDKESVDHLYRTIDKYYIKATWFLHVQAHENWLGHFHDFENQEIALHGYRHGTSGDASKVQANIQEGKDLLEQAGFGLHGFCAPYGIRNEALTQALRKFNFQYTSEFTFCYDGLPLQPSPVSQPLQIPIHPICTGSLNRKKYSPQQMSDYFIKVLARKAGLFEPVLFYHHPLQPALECLEPVFEKIEGRSFENLTFSEYAGFWKSREACRFTAIYRDHQLEIDTGQASNQFFQVSKEHQKFILTQASGQPVDFKKSPEFEYSKAYLPAPARVAQMRIKDLELMKTSLLDWKNRIRL